MPLPDLLQRIDRMHPVEISGYVKSILGLMIEVTGMSQWCVVGSRCILITRTNRQVMAEVVGFRGDMALVMPYEMTDGLGPGCRVVFDQSQAQLYPSHGWLGRVINGLGQPVDHLGPLREGSQGYALRQSPPPAHMRGRVEKPIDLGIRAINLFTTCCEGQRMGIFAGSGVGKSVLISMMAKFCQADVIVIGLIGERGREVQEFLQESLGPEGLARSVVVVATSDEAPLMRRQAAYATLTLAEYFADQGKSVLCVMDSVTRFAMSLREIGLSMGELPASKGYTPTVFAELPRLLERAGPSTKHRASITGLFTVLVEGDDHNEPIADAVRGILDGHIVLERDIAERGRFPAMNVLRSISRTMPDCNSPEHTETITQAKSLICIYEDMVDMIRLGAYKKGSDPQVDEAVQKVPAILALLHQRKEERGSVTEDLQALKKILGATRD